MKTYLLAISSACVVHDSLAFMITPHQTCARMPIKYSNMNAATVGNSSRSETSPRPRRKPTINEQIELQTIRNELIRKYISMGHSDEHATKEVNYFLEDEERSAQYVEMRRVAMARGNDLGIEMLVQFGAAFLVGMTGSWLAHSWDAYLAANSGVLPWMP